MQKEKFIEIKNHPFYKISNYGRILSVAKYNSPQEKILALTPDKKGYLRIKIEKKTYKVHRLVAQAFIKNKNKFKNHVNHKDGNKQNNHYKNLEWVTNTENIRHSFSLGLHNCRKGEKNNLAKLNKKSVLLIRKQYTNEDISLAALAKRYGVSKSTVFSIISRKTWAHV